MATSSSDDITTQLAALLGCAIKRLRITNEKPPRISVIDLAAVITTKDANQAAEQVSYIKKQAAAQGSKRIRLVNVVNAESFH